jgi:hypothetical protein
MQKPGFSDPAFLLDEYAMHDRNLTGRTSKAQEGDASPYPRGVSEGYPMTFLDGCRHSKYCAFAQAVSQFGDILVGPIVRREEYKRVFCERLTLMDFAVQST